MAISLAMTSHHFDEKTLKVMGKRIAEGNPPQLDPDSRRRVLEEIRKSRPLMERMRRLRPRPADDQEEQK